MKQFIKSLLNKRLNNEKGLTLIELLAVIVILAIIAAIAVPAIGNIIQNSRVDAANADAINILNAANLYFTSEGSDDDIASKTELANYVENWGTFEADATLTVTKANPNELDGVATLANGDTITFVDATVEGLTANPQDVDPVTEPTT